MTEQTLQKKWEINTKRIAMTFLFLIIMSLIFRQYINLKLFGSVTNETDIEKIMYSVFTFIGTIILTIYGFWENIKKLKKINKENKNVPE